MTKQLHRFLLLAVAILLTGGSHAHDVEVDGIYYNLNTAEQTASVTFRGDSYDQYKDEYSGNVVIPASITDNGVTYSVTGIGFGAFIGCSSLTSITIPESVTSIGFGAFAGCYSLTSITIPEGVTSIEEQTFYSCYSLTSVTIPESVTSIGLGVFADCYSLTSVNIPESVTSIGDEAFYGCSSLTAIDVSPDNSSYCSVDGILYNKDKTTLYVCPGGKTGQITIPEGVTSIESSAFYGCI